MKKDKCSMPDALQRTPNGGYSTSIKKRVSPQDAYRRRIENCYEIDGCTIG
ncbi:MAG TPA: hypothetical protein HPP66_13275 [Planctomycetes bacterium]|nr:hypothetical protein [Planctomycetota bacterium]